MAVGQGRPVVTGRMTEGGVRIGPAAREVVVAG
jgi:hypothetical protein